MGPHLEMPPLYIGLKHIHNMIHSCTAILECPFPVTLVCMFAACPFPATSVCMCCNLQEPKQQSQLHALLWNHAVHLLGEQRYERALHFFGASLALADGAERRSWVHHAQALCCSSMGSFDRQVALCCSCIFICMTSSSIQ